MPRAILPLSVLRPLSLSLLVVGVAVGVAHAQQPTATAFFTGPLAPGYTAGLYVHVHVGADAPGDATVSVDPLGVGQNTFVRPLLKTINAGTGIDYCPADTQCFADDFRFDTRLPAGSHQVSVTITDAKGRQIKLTVPVQTTADSDYDHDGLPDAWEEEFGLASYSADGENGAAGDPDGDGVSNLDEFKAGTNPMDKYVRYFAEGSSGSAQPLYSCVSVSATPSDSTVYFPVHITYIGDNGRKAVFGTKASNLSPTGACLLGTAIADRVVEIRVESLVPVVVERTIYSGWSAANANVGQLANASMGVQSPSRVWMFADGHTADGMDMFLLLFNPTSGPVNVDVAYVRAPSTVVAHTTRELPPGVRTTIWVNQDQPAALGPDVSMLVTADNGILAERAFRAHAPGRTVPHDSVTRGASVTATHWYFPDMDSRGPFASSLALINPTALPTRVTITAQFADRSPASVDIALTAGERRELTLRDLPVPTGTTFGLAVDATNGFGIVAERAVSGATESGAWRRSALGAMQTGTQWVFATSGSLTVNETDLAFLNASDTPAHVRIRMSAYNFECCDRSEAFVDIPARGSVHVPIGYNDPARTITTLPSGTITIDSLPNSAGNTASIVVERTNYWPLDGVGHARASSVMGSQVQ